MKKNKDNGTIIRNPITSYRWSWDKDKNPLDFGFKKSETSENEYTRTYPLWKDHGYTTIYAVFTVNEDDEDNQIDIDVREESGNTYGLFYRSTNEPIAQELSTKLLDILRTLNARAVETTFNK